MNPTPKQRSVIYRKAAELIDSKKEWFCCNAIDSLTPDYVYSWDMPEFKMFQPDDMRYVWFGDEKELGNKESRIFALLFASEIAKQK
jgi:hypothetical protein